MLPLYHVTFSKIKIKNYIIVIRIKRKLYCSIVGDAPNVV